MEILLRFPNQAVVHIRERFPYEKDPRIRGIVVVEVHSYFRVVRIREMLFISKIPISERCLYWISTLERSCREVLQLY